MEKVLGSYIEPETVEKLNQIVVNGQQGVQISSDA